MQRILQLLKIKRSATNKSLFMKGSISVNKAFSESDIKSYARMPKTFDFTAYFDDNELESIGVEIQQEQANTEIISISAEKHITSFFQQKTKGLSVV